MSLKDIRGSLYSIGSIMQITSAMKMVSASKLRKTRYAIYNLDIYIINFINIWRILSINLKKFGTNGYFTFFEKRPILIIIIASNRGLCGGFNTTIFRQILNNYSKYNSHLITIGKKVKDLLNNRFHLYKDHSILLENRCYNIVSRVCEMFTYDFLKGNFYSVHLIYNRLKNNSSNQELIREKILPIKMPCLFSKNKKSYVLLKTSDNYIINDIITKNIKIHFYKAILASYVAEQGSRMNAMHQATDNASNLKKKLLFIYNKTRQTSITKEIIEIMSGSINI